MVYEFPALVQKYNFSCLEELKCDAIENVLRIKEDEAYNSVNVVLSADLARKLYTMFLKADVNGFSLRPFEEYTNEEITMIMTENPYVVLSLTNQGIMFVEQKIYIDCEWPYDFWYVQEDYFDIVKDKIEKDKVPTLTFTITC